MTSRHTTIRGISFLVLLLLMFSLQALAIKQTATAH
jgi:hypothetical protein